MSEYSYHKEKNVRNSTYYTIRRLDIKKCLMESIMMAFWDEKYMMESMRMELCDKKSMIE